jgi:hypothetical protein
MTANDQAKNELREVSAPYSTPTDNEIDLSLLKDSLAKTAWERMQANDDALNFAESLRSAMKQRHATFK